MGTSDRERLEGDEAARRPLRLANLLNDADTLADLLAGQVDAGEWLDSFLLAAGLDQILEDALHKVPLSLDRIAARLHGHEGGRLGAGVGRAAGSAHAMVWALKTRRLRSSALAHCQQEAASLAADLADLVVAGAATPVTGAPRALGERVARLQLALAGLPAQIRRTPLRLPSAFRNLDTSPEDLKSLMGEVMRRWTDPTQPVLVVGIRTAGSYLAPLAAGSLRAGGRRTVRSMTMRPGQDWLPEGRQLLGWAAGAGALAIVVDDPPNTWATVAESADVLAGWGIERSSILLALQTFPSTSPPPSSLQGHPMVLMPWERFHIQGHLDSEVVRASLGQFLGGDQTVRGVERLPFDPRRGARGHVGALYQAEIHDRRSPAETRLIYLQGVGLGYFGAHAAAVSDRLGSFLPRVYGLAGGLLFRDWLPEELRIGQADRLDVADPIVDYVLARARALPVAEDMSRRLRGRPSLWRGIGRFLARPLGRAELLGWPFLEAWTKELLRVARPSVVDARTGLPSWFRDSPDSRSLKKIGFTEWAFSAYDTHCYDPVFDLAGAAASDDSGSLGDRLRHLYARRAGQPVDAERWLLYQLVHLANQEIDADVRDPQTERRMSARFQRYFADLLLADVVPAGGGPLCALDVDGVLESTPLGISATSLEGARALRALHKHGYRPVIVSGRSLGEVRERCVNYRAAGGVAEYGAGIYVTATGLTHQLLTEEERSSLDAVRSALGAMPGVAVDGSYALAVRAYRRGENGRRRSLSEDQVDQALRAVEAHGVRAIRGEAQTDFMVEQVTKATGVEGLAERLAATVTGQPALAMAMGDTASDLPMLRLAGQAFAPSNADDEVRAAGITVLRQAGQAGLAEATARLLGHQPGRCQACRQPQLPARSRLLMSVLSPPDQQAVRAKSIWAAAVLCRLTWDIGMARLGRGRRRRGAARRWPAAERSPRGVS